MWDLETSQRVEYPVEGRKCVSFTMRLSMSGMALRTAQQLEVDADVLFSVQLVGMDPTRPVVVMGRVTKREQDKAWVQFSPEQSSVEQIRDWIRTKVVPEMEKALATGTMCVTRIHGLTDFLKEFLPLGAGAGAAGAGKPAAAALPDPRVAELSQQLEAARRESLELTEKMAAMEAASTMTPDLISDFSDAPAKTDLFELPSAAEMGGPSGAAPDAIADALTVQSVRGVFMRYRKPVSALAGAGFLLGALLSFGAARATFDAEAAMACATPDDEAADPNHAADAKADPAAATKSTPAAVAPQAPAPSAPPTTAVAPPAVVPAPVAAPVAAPAPSVPAATSRANAPAPAAPVVAAPATPAPDAEAAPELAPPGPPASHVKKAASTRKGVARVAPAAAPAGPKPVKAPKKAKAVAGDSSKDDAFLDSVFP